MYLDNQATTPLDPQVLKVMLGALSGPPANPSSIHAYGRSAKAKLQKAREQVAKFFKVQPREVIFTSGGTESVTLAIQNMPRRILTTQIEHSSLQKAIKNPLYVPVDAWGAPKPEEIEKLAPQADGMAFSAANSETGVKLDLEAVARIAKKYNIPLFIDAIALIGKEHFTFHDGITAVAISAHKFHGPQGVGALITKKKPSPLFLGGHQENDFRAGTENLAAILGMAEALRLLDEYQEAYTSHIQHLRDTFEKELGAQINGTGPRIPSVSNLYFEKEDGETLLIKLDQLGIAASHGSACSAGSLEPSRVLTNMGYPKQRVRSSLRFSFSRMNSLDEILQAVKAIRNMTSFAREGLSAH